MDEKKVGGPENQKVTAKKKESDNSMKEGRSIWNLKDG